MTLAEAVEMHPNVPAFPLNDDGNGTVTFIDLNSLRKGIYQYEVRLANRVFAISWSKQRLGRN